MNGWVGGWMRGWGGMRDEGVVGVIEGWWG